MTPSHSALLRAKIQLVEPTLRAATRRLWASPDLGRVYVEYLCRMHEVIRSSVPLMETALSRAVALAPSDPVAAGVADYYRKHIPEERGHDDWLLEDLAVIGADPDEPLRRLPGPSVASLVGAQYYWIDHYHPVCLLGYIAVLEGYPPDPELVDILEAGTSYPRKGFRTIAVHAKIDRRHRDELLETIDALPLTPELVTALGVNALHTVRTLMTVFDELQDAANGWRAA
jgi:hypothetical protein